MRKLIDKVVDFVFAKSRPVKMKFPNGAGNGDRTRDLNLGKVALYH